MHEKKSSRDDMTLVKLCSQVEVHRTPFSLIIQSGSSQNSLQDSSFLFVWNNGKDPLHHDKDIDHPVNRLHFAELPQFLNTISFFQ